MFLSDAGLQVTAGYIGKFLQPALVSHDELVVEYPPHAKPAAAPKPAPRRGGKALPPIYSRPAVPPPVETRAALVSALRELPLPSLAEAVRLSPALIDTASPDPIEVAGDGIRVNAICPGYVLTPLVEAQIPDTMKEYNMTREQVERDVLLARQPSKQFATIEQIGGNVVFLCSPAAAWVSGQILTVSGGGVQELD